MAYLFKDFDETERIPRLENEITRLQELCRSNFGVIADLKKQNEKLTEIQQELKDTTSDLAYSLAECPWWELECTQGSRLDAFRVLITYAKNIQYILQLPIFFDPVEQLECFGMSREKALRYLKQRYLRKFGKPFKCPKCKKDFTTMDRRKKHLEFHSNMKKKLHCTQCNKYIQSFRTFKAHLQSHEFTNRMMAFSPIQFHQSQDPIGSSKDSCEVQTHSDKAIAPQDENKHNRQLNCPTTMTVNFEDMDCEVQENIPEKAKQKEIVVVELERKLTHQEIENDPMASNQHIR